MTTIEPRRFDRGDEELGALMNENGEFVVTRQSPHTRHHYVRWYWDLHWPLTSTWALRALT
jgi:hypothetical protein